MHQQVGSHPDVLAALAAAVVPPFDDLPLFDACGGDALGLAGAGPAPPDASAAAAAAAAVVALAPSLTTTLTRRSTSATCAAVPTADSACSRPAAPLVGLRSELRCCACAAVRAAQR